MKADYETKIKETLADNESRFQRQRQDHRAQLEALTVELDEWKRKSSTGQTNMIETASPDPSVNNWDSWKMKYITSSQGLLKLTEEALSLILR